MPAPYPQFIFNFTAARGIAMHLGTTEARALVEHLEGEVTGNDELTSEIVKEIHLYHSMTLTSPGLPDVALADAIANISPHAARGLVAALTGEGVVLSTISRKLLDAVAITHNIQPMDCDQARDALLVCSVVYTLPRMTAAVSAVSEHVISIWPELSAETRTDIRDFISAAITAGRVVEEVDKRGWIAVLHTADAYDNAVKPSF